MKKSINLSSVKEVSVCSGSSAVVRANQLLLTQNWIILKTEITKGSTTFVLGRIK